MQILNGKIRDRGWDPPVRDLYDYAVAAIEDPKSLEMVVNGQYIAKIERILGNWYKQREHYAEMASKEIRNYPEHLKEAAKRPAEYAIRAIAEAVYERVELRTDNHALTIATTSKQGIREDKIHSTEELDTGLHQRAMDHFIKHQRYGIMNIMEKAKEGMATGKQKEVLATEPEQPRLPKELGELPRLEPAATRKRPQAYPAIGQLPKDPPPRPSRDGDTARTTNNRERPRS